MNKDYLKVLIFYKNLFFRNKHDVDIDMRIGVHSGRILSGLVGASKWQYDIWSKDVLIANVMEQTGKPGFDFFKFYTQ